MPHFRKKQAEAELAAYRSASEKIVSAARREVMTILIKIFLVTAVTTAITVKIYFGMK